MEDGCHKDAERWTFSHCNKNELMVTTMANSVVYYNVNRMKVGMNAERSREKFTVKPCMGLYPSWSAVFNLTQNLSPSQLGHRGY